jgi:hypothetical protein
MLAFVLKPDASYDADRQAMTVEIKTARVFEGTDLSATNLSVSVRSHANTDKVSDVQNIFGARFQIRVWDRLSFDLSIHNPYELLFDEETRENLERQTKSWQTKSLFVMPFTCQFNIKPENARLVKPNLSALAICRVLEPTISEGVFHHEATFKGRIELTSLMCYLNVDLVEIWVYDKTDGSIVAKIRAK